MTNEENKSQHQKPFHQPEALPVSPSKNKKGENSALLTMMSLISAMTLGLALLSGVIVAVTLLAEKFIPTKEPMERSTLIYKAVPIAIAYIIGWIISLISIRGMGNMVLPYLINLYAWLTLLAIAGLYIAIIFKLYGQQHNAASFNKYMLMMAISFVAFIGLHLLLKDHSLIYFSIPLLMINLVHLFVIVYHYVYSSRVQYGFLWSDLFFFFEMTTVSVLMLLHTGVLSGFRNTIDRIFEPKPNGDPQPRNQQ